MPVPYTLDSLPAQVAANIRYTQLSISTLMRDYNRIHSGYIRFSTVCSRLSRTNSNYQSMQECLREIKGTMDIMLAQAARLENLWKDIMLAELDRIENETQAQAFGESHPVEEGHQGTAEEQVAE